MHISVQMTIHFFWSFCHVHLCKLDVLPILGSTSSWLPTRMGFCHAHFCTNDYPFLLEWVFVMHISVQMTIHFFWNGFYFCTNDYPFLFELHDALPIFGSACPVELGFRHAHFCPNDYSFLLEWVFVMHISVQMTIHFFFNGFSSCTFLY